MNSFFSSWKPDRIGLILGTGMMRFTHQSGCDGLARIDGDSLFVLAVGTQAEGQGNFRAFINDAKASFFRVVLMHDVNPVVTSALARYGFKRVVIWEQGEEIPSWEWRHKKE